MKNLKRYNLVQQGPFTLRPGRMKEEKDGRYVKFSDVKEILKSTHNKAHEEIFRLYIIGDCGWHCST